MSDDPMIAEAYKQLEKAKAVTWGGLTKDQQVVVLMVGFAQDAVAEAVKERDADIARLRAETRARTGRSHD